MNDSNLQEQALLALRGARKKLEELKEREDARNEAIAVIGLGCRFPGAGEGGSQFWDFLCNKGDAVQEIPADRWDMDAVYRREPGIPGKLYSRKGALLRDIAKFDAAFFEISSVEAVRMDPQQRLLLEVAWHAIEDAGQTWDRREGTDLGVFIGATMNDYSQLLREAGDWGLIDAFFLYGQSSEHACRPTCLFSWSQGACHGGRYSLLFLLGRCSSRVPASQESGMSDGPGWWSKSSSVISAKHCS